MGYGTIGRRIVVVSVGLGELEHTDCLVKRSQNSYNGGSY